jgi:radical SAM superfamily enzyme with C-terminal helix-hairpin-helix motif
MDKRPKQIFLKRRYTNGKHIHEKMVKSLIIRKMQIKTTMRYNLTLVKMTNIKKTEKQKMLARIWRKWNPCTLLAGM